MEKPFNKINNYIKKYGIKNLFMNKSFFDKEATIQEFFRLFPEEVKTCSTYDQLYQVAVSHVGVISFNDKTKDFDDYFYLLTRQDKIVALSIGILSYFIAKETDAHVKEIEGAIDKAVYKLTDDRQFDTNNPFDTKSGLGHRMFGHDPAAFTFKNIPSNYLIYVKNEAVPGTKKVVEIGKYLGFDKNIKYVSMWDVIWKFYGNNSYVLKGFWNCLEHIAVHFFKDLFTPDGLPIPFTSLLESFKQEKRNNLSVCILSYRDSFYKKSSFAHIKASDFTSLAAIEVLIFAYCRSSNIEKTRLEGYKNDMKLIAMSVCIMLQMSSLSFEQNKHIKEKGPIPIINGAKFNLPMFTIYMNIIRKECISLITANRELKALYKGDIYE